MNEMQLLVTYTAYPGQRETFLRAIAARGIAEAVRAEEGCLQYDYYLSLQDENVILLHERWTCADCQKVHMTQPHMAVLGELKEKYVEKVTLREVAEVSHGL